MKKTKILRSWLEEQNDISRFDLIAPLIDNIISIGGKNSKKLKINKLPRRFIFENDCIAEFISQLRRNDVAVIYKSIMDSVFDGLKISDFEDEFCWPRFKFAEKPTDKKTIQPDVAIEFLNLLAFWEFKTPFGSKKLEQPDLLRIIDQAKYLSKIANGEKHWKIVVITNSGIKTSQLISYLQNKKLKAKSGDSKKSKFPHVDIDGLGLSENVVHLSWLDLIDIAMKSVDKLPNSYNKSRSQENLRAFLNSPRFQSTKENLPDSSS